MTKASSKAATIRAPRRIWSGPSKPAPLSPEAKRGRWYMQTIRNMQALGFGHQRGKSCVVLSDGSARVLTETFEVDDVEGLRKHLDDTYGVESIQGVGYVYWNDMPEGLAEKVGA